MGAADQKKSAGPLAGIRVIDLTSVILGAYCTQMLGDLGADVIKIELPEGDTTRYTGPCVNEGMASLFMGVNRNKRSVALDLKQAAARDVLLRMVDGADAFVHNIRPQKLERIGLGADALMARNPRLIYAGLHGWREGGPYAGRPAYDDIMQGLTGIASLMNTMTGEPYYAPTILCDKTCGVMAAQAIVAALFHRERTGRGQFVEVPMFETMVSFVMVEHLHGATFDPPVGTPGYSRMLAPWRRPYRTSDGYLCTLIYTDAQWRRFWTAVGQPEMMDDPRFKDMAARSRNIADVYRIAEAQFAAEDHAGVAGAVRRARNPRRAAQFARRRAERPASRRDRFLQALRTSDRGRGRDDRRAAPILRTRPHDRSPAATARRAWPRGAG